jgi:hypothetical protein
VLLFLSALISVLGAYEFKIKNDVWLRAGYATQEWSDHSQGIYSLNGYYLPEIECEPFKISKGALDLLVGGYFRGDLNITQADNETFDEADSKVSGKSELYRGWLRWSRQKYEVRLGLQKLNFGTAFLLRNEQWFDSVDPRDAMGFTKGVWSALFRYYTANNGTIWLWSILGEEDLKGIEYLPSMKYAPEFGGRIQMPVFGSDQAVSYHFRQLDEDNLLGSDNEQRIALDGRWDTFVGFWYESTLCIFSNEEQIYNKFLTVGTDYTFNIGTGVHVLVEHLYQAVSENDVLSSVDEKNNTALQMDFSLGIYDSVQAIVVYDWDTYKSDSFWAVTHTTDHFALILSYSESTSLQMFSGNREEYDQYITDKTIQLTLRMTY